MYLNESTEEFYKNENRKQIKNELENRRLTVLRTEIELEPKLEEHNIENRLN